MSKALPIFGVIEELSKARDTAEILPRLAQLLPLVHSLAEDKDKAEKELSRLKSFRAQAKKYVTNTEDTGVVTHVHKDPSNPAEKDHRFCDHCHSNQLIRRLQPTGDKHRQQVRGQFGYAMVYNCKECDSKYSFNFEPDRPVPTRYASGGDWMGS